MINTENRTHENIQNYNKGNGGKEMKNTRKIGFFLMLACSVSVFAGCNKKDNKNKENETPTQEISDEQLMEAIAGSNPTVDVEVGDYEHLEGMEVKDVDALTGKKASSSWLDAPKNAEVTIVYDSTARSEVQMTTSLMKNLVNANAQLHTITIKDQAGNYLEQENNSNMLTTNGEKITVYNPAGYEYGRVYQIAINNAPFLCFENKDSSIRTLTLEIEDDPTEETTYNEKTRKTNITEVNLNKVSNKNINKENATCTFEYAGVFPSNLHKGDIFYVTGSEPNDKLDFYGAFDSKESVAGGKEIVTYTVPSIEDIYDSLRIKDVKDVNLEDDAELTLDDEVARRTFKQSSLARGIARAALPLVDNDLNAITSIMSNFQIKVNINMINNRLTMKFTAGIYNYKVSQSKSTYITIEFGYEKITDYKVDVDVSIETKWIVPIGVNYKIKCLEDTQEIFFLKATVTIGLKPDTPKDKKDWTDSVINEIDHIQKGDAASALSVFKDKEAQASTSGGKTTWPLLIVDVYAFSPISFRLRIDFYIDAGFQAMMCFQQETHSKKVDFCFTNESGAAEDADNTITKSSNWSVAFAGNIHIEIGFRASFSFSILGLHDYLHAEAYAELYINASVSGMLLADISFEDTSTEFSGYICIDLAVTVGMRVGLDFKILFVSENVQKTLWFYYLLRVLYENSMEHWSTAADTEIIMEHQTMNINETNVLWFNCFNSVTMGFEDNKFKGEQTISPFSGILVPQAFIDWTSTHLFKYEVLDHTEYISINENGVLHASNDAPTEFDATIRIGISNWGGTVSDRDITVHFHDSDAREIYMSYAGGHLNPGSGWDRMVSLLGEYRTTHSFTFPKADERRAFNFDNYAIMVDGNDIGRVFHEGDTIAMSQIPAGNTIEVVAWYVDKESYDVNFYDGKGNLVYEDTVYEGETATAPYAAMRDRYMGNDYTFIGWDRKLDDITADTDIHGIYISIGGK